VSLVVAALSRVESRFGRIGAEMGPESRLGIPVGDFLTLRERIAPLNFADAGGLLFRLRMVKSPAEVERIRLVCRAVNDGFDALPGMFAAGDTEASLCRKLHADLIARGVEKVPYLIGASGPGGYRSAILSPTDRRLGDGDILIIDTGSTCDGYFCDFDRNWAFGTASDAARRAYDVVWRATEAGIRAARPGARASDLWRAQAAVLQPEGRANVGSRMGHAIGLHLTEPPSNKPDDDTVLVPGMVMTIEPGLVYGDGALMLHEENLVITETGCELLTRRAPRELPVLPL
jgi:Xaa-Pro aminopeptidase